MKRKLLIIAIVLSIGGIALASALIDDTIEMLCIQGFDVPTSDAEITDDFSRAMLAGFYWPDGSDIGTGTHRQLILFHHHHD